MIPPQTAALATSIAAGLVRLTGRADRILSEKVAVTSDLAVPLPEIISGIGAVTMRKELTALVARDPDHLGEDLARLRALLADPDASRRDLSVLYRKWFPDAAVDRIVDPNLEFAKELAVRAPYLDLGDADVTRVVYFVSAGAETRENSYGWRLALTVVDALAEFGAENVSLLTRDERTRKVLQAVLERFSSPDLSQMASWGVLVRHALASTMNGVLDARDAFDGDALWVEVILDALVSAREGASEPDNYVMGLVRGGSYRSLIAALLEEGGARLAKEDAPAASRAIGDFLRATAPIVEGATAEFEDFFREHWADLVRSGLKSAAAHGSDLLAGASPPVKITLVAVVERLAATGGTEFLSKANLSGVVDAVLAAVAAKPDVFLGPVGDARLKAILESVAGVAAKEGVETSVSREGLARIGKAVLTRFAERPELLVRRPGLYREMVGDVIESVAGLDRLSATSIAAAAVAGALEAVSASPELLDRPFTAYVAHVAGRVSALVAEAGLDRVQAAGLLSTAMESFAENPELLSRTECGLFDAVLDAVDRAADLDDAKLLVGSALTATFGEVLAAFARHGARRAEGPIDELVSGLAAVVTAGAERASVEVGHRIGMRDVPQALGKLAEAWLTGRLGVTDPEDPGFKRIFAEVVDGLAA